MLFAKSLLLGWIVALPVGPVALLIINRTLTVGRLAGVSSCLGAAVADALLGFLAALGLAVLVGEAGSSPHIIRPLGSLALAVVGAWFFFRDPPPLEPEEVLSERYLHHYLWDGVSTFLLTLTNPMTIIAFAVLFAGSELVPADPRRLDYLEVASGVATGGLVWWLLLVAAAEPIRRRLSPHTVHRIFQVLGVALVVLAAITFGGRFRAFIDRLPFLSS